MDSSQLEKELNSLRCQAKASAQLDAFFQKAYARAQRENGGQQPNMAQILLFHIYIIEEITVAYINSKGGNSAVKNLNLTDAQMNQIGQFCQKANNIGKTVSYGASGAALGASLFGWLGLIGGAIVGAAAGSNSTRNDRAAFISILNDTIDYYYNCLFVLNQPLYLAGEPNKIENIDILMDKTELTAKDVQEGEDAEKQLNSLIGLSSIKRQVMMMKASLKKQKFTNNKINLHMCFYGNPGTGKTEVARLISKIFYKEGILPTSNFIETDRSGLVANFIGQTATKTHNIFKKAMGGVLFIDEAYSLAEGGDQDFGKEAVAALLKDMEDYRDKVCVILAGYRKPMEKMFELNPGFKSRVNRYIDFPNYSREEIKEIVIFLSEKAKYSIDENALAKIVDIVMSKSNESNFANAREARNVLDSIIDIQALRTESNVSDTNIILDDVNEYISFNGINL